ncbi:MAG: DciA family protein [Hydrogenophilus sp.]|nr:DciA family protein [Hydrogenophilus sp.]
MTLRPLPEAAKDPPSLAHLWQQGVLLWRIQTALAEILPADWCGDLRVGRLEQGVLTLMSSSALTVARLKTIAPTILSALRERGLPVEAIRWRVRPDWASGQATAPTQTERGKAK